MVIGAKLKQARESKRISQEELALMLKTTQKTISNWESDKSIPSLDYLAKIEAVLEVDIFLLPQNDNPYTILSRYCICQ